MDNALRCAGATPTIPSREGSKFEDAEEDDIEKRGLIEVALQAL